MFGVNGGRGGFDGLEERGSFEEHHGCSLGFRDGDRWSEEQGAVAVLAEMSGKLFVNCQLSTCNFVIS
jgi:hypothetical protein